MLSRIASNAVSRFASPTISTASVTAALAALSALALSAPAANAQANSIFNFEVMGGGQSGSTTLYNGTGALAGAGNTWNVLTLANQTVTNAKASNGQTSAVAFFAQFANESRNPYTTANDGVAGNADQLLSNFARTGNSSLVLQLHFSGLAANTAFTLDLYGANGADGAQRGTIFKQTLSDYASVLQTASTVNLTQATFVQGDNYVVFNGTTDATGNVYATYQANTATNGNLEAQFNGAQIRVGASAAPEPSALALLVPGAIGMVGMRAARRNRAGG